LSLALISGRGGDVPPVVAASEVGVQPAHLALAHAFTAALNAHDVEALVDLFSDEGAGPTVHADRYAWTKFEICLWTQHQIRSNIRVDASEYWATDHGAGWRATVHREDLREAGVDGLPVFNTIFVEGGKIVDFTSKLANPRDAERLQHLWRPGSLPDYPAPAESFAG
jgi:hypothetical protein